MCNQQKIFCYGCGIELQSLDSSQKGYIPLKKMNSNDNVLCQRCYRIKHYGELVDDYNGDINKTLENAIKFNDLIVLIIDVFDIESSLDEKFINIIKNNDIIIVINKVDILPKDINLDRVMERIEGRIKRKMNFIKVIDFTTKNDKNLQLLLNDIIKYKKERNVYMVGVTSVGKSSIINSLLKKYSLDNELMLTTSKTPGTTQNLIEIPLPDNTFLFDTPGFESTNSLLTMVDKENLNIIIPKRTIKPISIMMKPGQSLFFGSIIKLDYIEGNNITIICYFSSLVNIHKVSTTRANESFNTHIGKLMPTLPLVKRVDDLHIEIFKMKIITKIDISIAGLGFLTIVGQGNTKINIHKPKNLKITTIESMI